MKTEIEAVYRPKGERMSFVSANAAKECHKVLELYESGTNWDKAVLQVLQGILDLPICRWDFGAFYSENPEDAEIFNCKALLAGAVGIYLDIIKAIRPTQRETQSALNDSIYRVISLFNTLLRESSARDDCDGSGLDPFSHDEYLVGFNVVEDMRNRYEETVTELFKDFKKEFSSCYCQEIRGFDPSRYDEYDEQTQVAIDEGEWMQKCRECMQFVIRTIYHWNAKRRLQSANERTEMAL